MSVTYYCPSCWSEIARTSICPVCGVDLQGLAGQSYEEKLIRALGHPEPTVPIRAATILGELGSRAAVEPLINVARSSPDPYIQEAAVAALGCIGDLQALPCIDRLSRDGALRVRKAARWVSQLLKDARNAARS